MLQPPPAEPGSLADLTGVELHDQSLYRVWVHDPPGGDIRDAPWWFSSVDEDDPEASGRFDLPAPRGTMHLAGSPIVAWLEAMQVMLTALPVEELRVRRLALISPHPNGPPAADMTDASISALATQEFWAGSSHIIPQQWAAAVRRDGWWALSAPTRHATTADPSSVALFNEVSGAQVPQHGGGPWSFTAAGPAEHELVAELAERGVSVVGPANLPEADDTDRQRHEG